jgi:hypothetical protein
LLTNENVLSIFGLFNDFSRNELDQKLFPNQALLSHASTVGMTYKGVAPLHMAQLKGLAHARSVMWRHVGTNHARASRLT